MKPSYLVSLATAASAAVLPGGSAGEKQTQLKHDVPVTSPKEISPALDDFFSSLYEAFGFTSGVPADAPDAEGRIRRPLKPLDEDDEQPETTTPRMRYTHEASETSHQDVSSESVYQIIRQSERGRRFVELLDEHKGLRETLADRSRDLTVFLPTDEAFRKLNGLERKDGVLVEEILKHHILWGRYSVDMLRGLQTVPTLLAENEMGHRPQRLRVDAGVELDFYSQLLASDSKTGANGVVHFVDNVLVPPPRHDKLVDAAPEMLGTFSHAMKWTGLSEELRARNHRGVTVFAPSNTAWDALRPDVRSFLFSDEGWGYLEALTRYHVLADEVVYTTDVYYDGAADADETGHGFRTLLGGADILLSGSRREWVISLHANGEVISVRDIPTRDGVVHVLDAVLFPPRVGSDVDVDGDGRLSVEGVKRRLGPFTGGEERFEL